MNQAEFNENFARLTDEEKKILKLIVLGKPDLEIARECHIADTGIRKKIEKIRDDLGIPRKEKGKRRSRGDLIAFVLQYKPELLGNSTPTVVNPPEELPTEAEELDGVEETEAFNREFLGRGPAMAELDECFRNGAKAVLIWAGGGVGKTTLAREFFKAGDFELVLELEMGRETQVITPVESVVEYWFTNDLQQEWGREFGLSLRRLKEHLKTHRIGIFIDNLEPALDNGLFIEPHRQYVELLRVLTDPTVQSVTLITSRERLCESGVSIELFHLQGLDKQAWEQYFTSRKMAIDTSVLEQMHHAYGGNAKAMEILWGAIREDYSGDMAAYWRDNDEDLLVHRELEDLVTRQFKRLEGQNPQAYRLLCRMGCFRYQDVPRVPIEALLCLLWDVPENPHRLIRALRDRALIECEKGEYWLHPVIRAEAIARLRSGEDWERANQEAAKFWTGSVDTVETIEQALTAFEAYHHYVQIEDFESAGQVFINRKYMSSSEKLKFTETLAASFWRVGLLSLMIIYIETIIEKINNNYCLALLNLMLGYSKHLTGYPNRAIEYHLKSKNFAQKILENYKLNNSRKVYEGAEYTYVASFINIGAAHIDLGDFLKAIDYFEKAYNISAGRGGDNYQHTAIACWCLSFSYSVLNKEYKSLQYGEKAIHYAEKAAKDIEVNK